MEMLFTIRTYLVGKYHDFDRSDNCFVVMMFCNRLIGFMGNPGNDTDRLRFVKRILIGFAFIYAMFETVSVVLGVVRSGFGEHVTSLFLVSCRLFCISIWCSLAVNRHDLKQIWIYLLSVQRDTVDDRRRGFIRFLNWFMLMFLMQNLLPMVVWICTGQTGSPLAVYASSWIDRLNTVFYPIAVLIITLMLCYTLIVILSIMPALTLEFRLLGHDFQQIFEGFEVPNGTPEDRLDSFEQAFKRCVDRHQTLLATAALLRQQLKTYFLIQLLINFFLIVLNSFMYVLMRRNEGSGFAFSAFSVIVLMMNLLLYGFLCDQLEGQVSSIARQLYCSAWTEQLIYSCEFGRPYKNLRQLMLIVMERTQKKVGFSCGSFFEMSLVTCRKVLWFAYSVLAVLMNLLE